MRVNSSDSAAIFRKTKPYEDLRIDRADPRSVTQEMFGGLLSGRMTMEEFNALMFSDPQLPDEPVDQKQFQQMMSMVKSQLGNKSFPLVVIADMVISNMHFTTEGDDSVGYKIIMESPGAPAQDLYVVRDGGRYKAVGYSATGSANLEDLAPLALRALDQGNLAAARRWLDWAREEIQISGGDDPLAGPPFPYFWTKGQDGDVATIRTAALVLLRSKDLNGPYLAALEQARQAARDLNRNRLTMVLAYAYSARGQWSDMLPLTQELMKSLPTSVRAFNLAATAYAGLKRFDEWDKLVQARTSEHPDELAYNRSAALLAKYRGDFEVSGNHQGDDRQGASDSG